MNYLYIAIGGAIGSVCRYLLSDWMAGKWQAVAFPLGTFSVNLVGSLLAGFLFGLFSFQGQVDDKIRLLVFVGFLGGFTTFSAFALENVKLLNHAQFYSSLLYILSSNVVGIVLSVIGYQIGMKIK